jgi:hypothetical protein
LRKIAGQLLLHGRRYGLESVVERDQLPGGFYVHDTGYIFVSESLLQEMGYGELDDVDVGEFGDIHGDPYTGERLTWEAVLRMTHMRLEVLEKRVIASGRKAHLTGIKVEVYEEAVQRFPLPLEADVLTDCPRANSPAAEEATIPPDIFEGTREARQHCERLRDLLGEKKSAFPRRIRDLKAELDRRGGNGEAVVTGVQRLFRNAGIKPRPGDPEDLCMWADRALDAAEGGA